MTEIDKLKQKIHILTESQVNLENTLGSQADYFQQKISTLEDKVLIHEFKYKEAEQILRRCRKWIKGYNVFGEKENRRKDDILKQIEDCLR